MLVRFSAGAALVLGIVTAAAPAHAALFGAPTTITVGASPIRLAVFDFNGDGKLDVAVPNRGSDTVSLLVGNGLGALAAPSSIPVATAPEAIAVGDFDKNGSLDMAVSTQLGKVHVLLGNGAGGFAEAAGSPLSLGAGSGNTSYGIVVADFNQDGNLDLAATAHDASYVAVFLGSGAGAFSAAPGSPHATGAGPMSLVVADFNGDGHLDLASSAEGTSTTAANNVTVLLGAGTGTFTNAPGSPFAAQNGPTGLATGDFNEDGKVDLACSHEAAGTVLVFAGQGTGAFTPLVTLTAGVRAFGIAVSDFDVDGHLDLATADNGPGQTHVFHGNGAGAFTDVAGSPFAVAPGPAGIVAADLDRDGAPDLVFGNVGSGTMTVLLNETVVVLPDGGLDASMADAAHAGDGADSGPASDAGGTRDGAPPADAASSVDGGASGERDGAPIDLAEAGAGGELPADGPTATSDCSCRLVGARVEDAVAPLAFAVASLVVARRRSKRYPPVRARNADESD